MDMATTPQHMAREVIAGNIRALMGRHRISQTEVGRWIGISQPSVSQRLNGDVAFDTDELFIIAAKFDKEVTALLEGISDQGASEVPWITTRRWTEDGFEFVDCEGQESLFEAGEPVLADVA